MRKSLQNRRKLGFWSSRKNARECQKFNVGGITIICLFHADN